MDRNSERWANQTLRVNTRRTLFGSSYAGLGMLILENPGDLRRTRCCRRTAEYSSCMPCLVEVGQSRERVQTCVINAYDNLFSVVFHLEPDRRTVSDVKSKGMMGTTAPKCTYPAYRTWVDAHQTGLNVFSFIQIQHT
jgi:hypothetical protein